MTVSATFSSVYPCDSDSVYKQITNAGTSDQKVSCNGIAVTGPYDRSYDAIISKPGKWGNGNYGGGHYGGGDWGTTKTTIKLTNYTKVYTFNNGNFNLDKIFNVINLI